MSKHCFVRSDGEMDAVAHGRAVGAAARISVPGDAHMWVIRGQFQVVSRESGSRLLSDSVGDVAAWCDPNVFEGLHVLNHSLQEGEAARPADDLRVHREDTQ